MVLSTIFTQCTPETTKYRKIRTISPFKVIVFGTNRKLIYGFLLVINTNLPPILYRF